MDIIKKIENLRPQNSGASKLFVDGYNCAITDVLDALTKQTGTNTLVSVSVCKHEFISREYASQPYGTCASCGKTVFAN